MRLLVTAGPTREYFDSVRFISNPSTGKMGLAIAAVAIDHGHDVDLVLGPVEAEPPAGARTLRVTTAAEMFDESVRAFASCDAAVLTAAVCDYRPRRRQATKLKKRNQPKTVTLTPTRDIAAHLGRNKGPRITVCFAMEDYNGRAHAEQKLKRKNCDAIVLNGRENIGSDTARVEILERGGRWSPELIGTKRKVARTIVRLVESLLADRPLV